MNTPTIEEKYIYEIIHPSTRVIKSKWFTLKELIVGCHWDWMRLNEGFISYKSYLDRKDKFKKQISK